MWLFAVPMLFMGIFVDTLMPSAVFGLVQYLLALLLMPYVGSWVDSGKRVRVYVRALAGENLCVCISSALMAFAVILAADGSREDRTTAPEWTWQLGVIFAVVCAFGVGGQVLNQAQSIAVEQDWVVVLSGGSPKVMQTINIELTRIDQMCGILAPMLFGFVLQYGGPDRVSRNVTGGVMVACTLPPARQVVCCFFVSDPH